jgi:maleylacetate reductase
MLSFLYEALPCRVLFGPGTLDQVNAEVERLGCSRTLVLTTPEQQETGRAVLDKLDHRGAGLFDGAVMHVPVEVAEAARRRARELQADCCVSVGGGSTTGLAKAIALTERLPIVAVPTSYAGSEMTPIWGLTEAGKKTTGRDTRVLPKTAIYDPSLTLSMPALLSATSGINAIAHCAEALYAKDANPVISMIAEEGIRALAASLPLVTAELTNLEARSRAFYGAWLGGIALGAVGMALHHKLCHTVAGTFNLPHAETHTVLLPHAIAYNAPAAPEAMSRIARATGAVTAAQGLLDLARRVGAPTSLAAIGMKREDLDRAADLAVQNPYYNPRPVTRDEIRVLLQNAYDGRQAA